MSRGVSEADHCNSARRTPVNAPTGRMDGENYNIGIVDVTDRPYRELVEAMQATHERLLAVHSGKQPPVSRKAEVQ